MQPKVSVIVPVYNSAKFLKKCLNSLLKQTLKDIEIICVENNSTDKSLEILKKYAQKDERIVIVYETKQGLSAARNKGIDCATGEYLGFVDSDDWVSLDYFEKMYKFAKLYDANIACATIRRRAFLRNSLVLCYFDILYTEDLQEKINITGIPAKNYVWNKIYKRDAFNAANLRFMEGIYFEDVEFALKSIHKIGGGLVTVPGVEYLYRYRKNSIVNTTKKNTKKQDDFDFAYAFSLKYAYANSIKIDEHDIYPKKKYVSLFGKFILWKTYYFSKKYSLHKLFGIIPVFSSSKS